MTIYNRMPSNTKMLENMSLIICSPFVFLKQHNHVMTPNFAITSTVVWLKSRWNGSLSEQLHPAWNHFCNYFQCQISINHTSKGASQPSNIISCVYQHSSTNIAGIGNLNVIVIAVFDAGDIKNRSVRIIFVLISICINCIMALSHFL